MIHDTCDASLDGTWSRSTIRSPEGDSDILDAPTARKCLRPASKFKRSSATKFSRRACTGIFQVDTEACFKLRGGRCAYLLNLLIELVVSRTLAGGLLATSASLV
jgi:hypothetical protein